MQSKANVILHVTIIHPKCYFLRFTTYVSSEVLFVLFAVESNVLVITNVELVDDG